MRAILVASRVMVGLCINCPLPWHARAVTKSNSQTAPRVTVTALHATSPTAAPQPRTPPAQAATKSRSCPASIALLMSRKVRVIPSAQRVTTFTLVGLGPTARRAWPAMRTSPTTSLTRSDAPAVTPSSVDGDSSSASVSASASVTVSVPTASTGNSGRAATDGGFVGHDRHCGCRDLGPIRIVFYAEATAGSAPIGVGATRVT